MGESYSTLRLAVGKEKSQVLINFLMFSRRRKYHILHYDFLKSQPWEFL